MFAFAAVVVQLKIGFVLFHYRHFVMECLAVTQLRKKFATFKKCCFAMRWMAVIQLPKNFALFHQKYADVHCSATWN